MAELFVQIATIIFFIASIYVAFDSFNESRKHLKKLHRHSN